MDTFLTLVIALGGIATGIGAIWAALASRRQAQVTERQAQLTERSLTEQRQSLAEQNERARLTLEYDLMSRLTERFVNPHLLTTTRAAAKYLLDNAFVEDDMVGAPSLNLAVMEICNMFEEVGEMVSLGVLRAELVWSRFGIFAQTFWLVCQPAIEKLREEWEDPALYEDFEYLSRLIAETDSERGVSVPKQEQVRQVLEAMATSGQEPPTKTE
jgi:hypothetical protein